MADVRTPELVINKLTKQQYENIQNPSDTEMYLVPEDEEHKPICYPTTASEVQTTSMVVKSSVSDNGKILTENGFVYNTSGNPTISDTKVICDLGVGLFEKKLENLTINTEYHIKSYGQNSSGLVYGSELVQRTQSTYVQNGLVFHLDARDFDENTSTIIERINQINFDARNVSRFNNKKLLFASGSYLQQTDNLGITLPTSNYTIEVSCKIDFNLSTGGYMIFQPINYSYEPFLYNHRSDNHTFLKTTRTSLGFYLPDSNNTYKTISLPNIPYCNNIALSTDTSSNYTNAGFTNYIRIGSRGDGSWQFFGEIYNIRIYNRVLTVEEIQSNYLVDSAIFYD
jgi:hypothetical protein